MEKAASKNMRGFASTLRLVVDKKNEVVNISNPIYVMAAFMQKDYDSKLAEDTLKSGVISREDYDGLYGLGKRLEVKRVIYE